MAPVIRGTEIESLESTTTLVSIYHKFMIVLFELKAFKRKSLHILLFPKVKLEWTITRGSFAAFQFKKACLVYFWDISLIVAYQHPKASRQTESLHEYLQLLNAFEFLVQMIFDISA